MYMSPFWVFFFVCVVFWFFFVCLVLFVLFSLKIILIEEMLIGHPFNSLFSSFQLSGEQQGGRGGCRAHLNVWPVARKEQGVATSLLPAGWSRAGRSPRRQKRSEGRALCTGAESERRRGNNRTEITGEARPASLSGAFEWSLRSSGGGGWVTEVFLVKTNPPGPLPASLRAAGQPGALRF